MSSPPLVLKRVRDSESGARTPSEPKAIHAFEHRALRLSSDAIRLDRLAAYDRVVVTTARSEYELIVLGGGLGEVLVRGGDQFPEFCQARFAGSTAGGSALKRLTIDVGLRMEFQVGRSMVVTTSAVQALSVRPDGAPRHDPNDKAKSRTVCAV